MFKLYCDTVAPENSTELQKQQFADLLAFSGKSMNGKNMESFENTIEFAKQEGINLDNLSDAGFMALSQHFYSIGSEVVPRSPLEDLVERFSEKFGKS